MTFSLRARRTATIAATGVIALASCLMTTSSVAAPVDGATRAAAGESSVRYLPTPKPRDALFGTGIATSTRVSRSKVNIAIPGITALVYAGTQTRLPLYPENGVYPVPAGLEPPNPRPQCNYYVNEIQNDLYVAVVDEQKHRFTSLGRFPPVRVSVLAFGSVPLTATLRTSQVVRNGKFVPIRADTVGNGASIRKSEPQNSTTYGCDPDWERAMPPVTISTGEVNATLTDVVVDGGPVDVGPNCHTASPLQLRLIGEPVNLGGSYGSVTEGGTLTMSRDTRMTGENVRLPLYPKSRNLTVPDFEDCRGANGEDLSRLVSALVSGPDATVAVQQSPITFALTNLENPSLCDLFDGRCPVPPANARPPVPGR